MENRNRIQAGTIRGFTDLKAWQLSHQVVINVYLMTKKFPREERFGLCIQMRRAAVSITSNIAEGFGRNTYRDKLHFYFMARGSITELRNQLIVSKDINYINNDEYQKIDEVIDHAQKLLHGLIKKTSTFI